MSRYNLVLLTVLYCSIWHGSVWADRLRCEKPDYISNGSFRLKRNFMRVTCDAGYQLQGLKTIGCVRGKWDGEKPVCAKKGCLRNIETPDNGRIQIESELKAILYCSDNYSLAGNRHSYCNGTHWDRPIGTCRERSEKVSHDCDFETDDVCGWSYEPRANLEWKRVMAANVFTSFRTGPRHDHTTLKHNGGHYMLMESLIRQFMPVTLTSPIYDRQLSLKTACCFQFYYFMYGVGIGDLLVVVKPVSISLEDILISRNEFIKFERNGNQNSNWNEAHFTIPELEEDFQIIFVAKAGRNQLSDIAVDDVRLLTGQDCKDLDAHAEFTLPDEVDDTTIVPEQSLYEIQSCVGRCYNTSGLGVILEEGHLKGLCSCDVDCEDAETCCPDFKAVCVNELFDVSPQDSSSVAPEAEVYTAVSITPKSISTTTTSTTTTTTTTPKPTTRATTATIRTMPTTTTVKTTPTTLRTTAATTTTTTTTTTPTTTTTTKKPTTPKTTTTTRTTTTRKPTTTARTTIRTTKTTPSTTTTTTRRTTTTTRRATTTTRRTTTLKTTTTSQPTTTTTTTTQKPTITAAKTTTAAWLHPTTNSSANIPDHTLPVPASKKIHHIIDSDPKVEAAHRGSSVLICILILVVIIFVLAAAYRRYGDNAVAWYMIHFRKSSGGDEATSSIITSFRGAPTNTTERIAEPVRKKPHKKASYSSDMKRPLVEDDDEDDDCNAVNGSIALKDHIYTQL